MDISKSSYVSIDMQDGVRAGERRPQSPGTRRGESGGPALSPGEGAPLTKDIWAQL